MKRLLFLFLLIPALSFGQSIPFQYNQGKQRVSDSIGFYPTYPNHYIDKITTAGCWWNLWDFALNIYDSLNNSAVGVSRAELADSTGLLIHKWDSTVGYSTVYRNDTGNTNLRNYIATKGTGTVTSITAGTGLSGGVITTAGTISMPNVGTASTHGSATLAPQITTDVQGRVTTILDVTITPAWTNVMNTPTTIAGYGITDPIVYTSGSYSNPAWITALAYSKITGVPGFLLHNEVITSTATGDITWSTSGTTVLSPVTTLKNTGTGAGTVGDATHIPVITFDAQGRETEYTTSTFVVGSGTVTSVGTTAPLSGGTITGSGTISIPKATSTTDGYLAANDWTNFNNKGSGNGTVTNVIGGTNITISGTSTVQPTVSISGTIAVANGGTNATTTTSINTIPITYGSNNTITAAPSGGAGGSLTGTYPNPTVATIPSGATGTTQTALDNSTKIATTAYVDVPLLAIQTQTVTAASYTTSVTCTTTSTNIASTVRYVITAQAGALLFNNPSGTWSEGEMLIIRIKDNGIARALTYGTNFRGTSPAIPATTVINETLYEQWIYNATDTKFDLSGFFYAY